MKKVQGKYFIVKQIVLILTLCMTFLCSCFAFEGNEYNLKAMFLVNFTKYFEWPNESNSSSFIIGVIGSNEIYSSLVELNLKSTADGKTILIKKISSDMKDQCNILFIGESENKKMEEVILKYGGKGVLVVSENMIGKIMISDINLVKEENKIRFELNLVDIKKSGLKISSKLIELSKKTKQ